MEPARPAAIAGYPSAHWLVLATVCMGAFIGQLDASIVTLAFPTLQGVFHASVGAVTWVGLTYLLVLVTTVTAIGRFADMVGRKLLYTYGFLVFVIGSALCGLAPSLGALDAFRALQAVGAAMLQANSVAIIYLAMPRGSLGRGIGIQGAAQAMGLALGPAVGGFLIAAGGWRLIFLVNVPIGLVGMVAAWLFIPRSRNLQPRVRFDWVGVRSVRPRRPGVARRPVVREPDRMDEPTDRRAARGGRRAGDPVHARERRCVSPMVDLSLFRRIPFSAGISSGLLSYLVMFGVLFAVPFFLERSRHLTSSQVGLQLTVMPLALGITAPFAGEARRSIRLPTPDGRRHGAHRVRAGIDGVRVGGIVGADRATGAHRDRVGSVHPAEQRLDHGGGAAGAVRARRGHPQHDPGLGTAFGLALTAAVYEVAAGTGLSPVDAAAGFRASAAFLACVAVAATALAGLRGGRRLEVSTVGGSSR